MQKRELTMNDVFDLGTINFNLFGDPEIETTKTVSSRILKRDEKTKTINAMKKQKLSEVVKQLPKTNESFHIISNGDFDFFTFIPYLICDLMGGCNEFYGSTWTLNRNNCVDMLNMFDDGKIKSIGFLTGIYFKRRESAVYARLLEGMQQRNQKYKCLETHAKVAIFENGIDFIVIEGSANFTANPRIEQYCVTNSIDLYNFHKNWIEECLNG